jgi:hypothetical protein
MLRDMSVAMQTAVDGPVFRPVLIAFLDIQTDPIGMWTGVGTLMPSGTPDSIINGKTFYPLSAFIDVSEIKEDDGIGGPVTVRLKGARLDEDALQQVVADKRQWQGRSAYLWLGIYNAQLNAVLEYPIMVKAGILTRVRVMRSIDSVSVDFTIDEDMGDASGVPFFITNHREFYPSDTFSAYMVKLANKPGGLESSSGIVT